MRYLLFGVVLLFATHAKNLIAEAANGSDDSDQEDDNKEPNLEPSKAAILSCTIDGVNGRCVKPNICEKPQEAKDSTTLFTYRKGGCPHYSLQCCPLDQVKMKPAPPREVPDGCGWSNPGGYGLRNNAQGIANFGEFPWMIALLKRSDGIEWREKDYLGGGSLIHPSVVLTVAHKVENKDPTTLRCRAGEWDTQTNNEILPHQDRNVMKILIHDDFLHLRGYFDGALLIMERPFVLQSFPHIGVACLGRDMPRPGTLCYSMGWGQDFKNKYAVTLKKVELPMVGPSKCQNQLRNTRLGSNYQLHHSLTCAGGNGNMDTCIGDGGSSLVCPGATDGESTRYVMYGMVVFGVRCGVKNEPGLYAKVPTLVDWIDKVMTDEKLDKSTYYIQS